MASHWSFWGVFAAVGLGFAACGAALADGALGSTPVSSWEPICINGFSRGARTCTAPRRLVRIEPAGGQLVCVNSYGPAAAACATAALPGSTAIGAAAIVCLNGYGATMAPCPLPPWGNRL